MSHWICADCGNKYGRYRVIASTWHMGYCEWCGRYEAVTESRDYGHPEPPT